MEDEKRKQAQISALRMLAASPKSSQDLKRKLSGKGFDTPTIEATLSNLQKQGLLSDKAYAQNLVSRYTSGQPSGTKRIAFELKRRGIPPKIRQELLEALSPAEETERAREIATARWQRLEKLPLEKRKKRLYDFLLRRGFEYEIIREVVEGLR